MTSQNTGKTGEIVLYQPDNSLRLEVLVEDENVWLTQIQIASLFEKDRTVITKHINNVFLEGELEEESNVHFLHIPFSDKPTKLYNLDVCLDPCSSDRIGAGNGQCGLHAVLCCCFQIETDGRVG